MSATAAFLLGAVLGFLVAVVLAVLLRGAGDPAESNASGRHWAGDWI